MYLSVLQLLLSQAHSPHMVLNILNCHACRRILHDSCIYNFCWGLHLLHLLSMKMYFLHPASCKVPYGVCCLLFLIYQTVILSHRQDLSSVYSVSQSCLMCSLIWHLSHDRYNFWDNVLSEPCKAVPSYTPLRVSNLRQALFSLPLDCLPQHHRYFSCHLIFRLPLLLHSQNMYLQAV